MKKEKSLSSEYKKKIDWSVHPGDLCLAASLTIWMIVDKNFKLATAIEIAARKNGVKKAPLGRVIKECIPASFFSDRRAAKMSPELKHQIRNEKIQRQQDRKRIAAL